MTLLYDMLLELVELTFVVMWMVIIYLMVFFPLNYLLLLVNQQSIIIGEYEYVYVTFLASCLSSGIAIYTFRYYEKLREAVIKKVRKVL